MSYDDFSLFIRCRMGFIIKYTGQRITENSTRFFKTDFMLLAIDFCFLIIPFKFHTNFDLPIIFTIGYVGQVTASNLPNVAI